MTETTPQHRPVRVGTIVWGAILLVVAAFGFLSATLGIGASSPAELLWTIVGFGAVLVVAAVIIAIVRAARPRDPDQPIG
jgi:hypothetical protein